MSDLKYCQGPECHTHQTKEQRPLTESQYNDTNYTLNERG